MLTIRHDQLIGLAKMRESRFLEKMVLYVATEFPTEYGRLQESGARKWVFDIFQLAAQHNVDAEGAIATMVHLSMMFGPRLERSPEAAWANEFLAKTTIPDTLRLQM